MRRDHLTIGVLLLLAVAGAGCGASIAAEEPAMPGRRVQGAHLVAQGAVPYQVGAYELVFAERPAPALQVRRAALSVDLVDGRGQVRGFVEWGQHEPPAMYAAGGWAQLGDPADLALRVVLNEASGDVTLNRRR